MRFNNIKEFENFKIDCEFCGSDMSTELLRKKTPSYKHYSLDFTSIIPSDSKSDFLRELSGEYNMSYATQDYQNDLVFQYELLGRSHSILSIDKINNEVSGELDKVQKVMWDHELHVLRTCHNPVCSEKGRHYISEGTKLVLERVNKKICPFRLEAEMLTIEHRGKTYGLLSAYDRQETILFTLNENKIIHRLPFMHLHKIRGGEVIFNKIKTLLVFS